MPKRFYNRAKAINQGIVVAENGDILVEMSPVNDVLSPGERETVTVRFRPGTVGYHRAFDSVLNSKGDFVTLEGHFRENIDSQAGRVFDAMWIEPELSAEARKKAAYPSFLDEEVDKYYSQKTASIISRNLREMLESDSGLDESLIQMAKDEFMASAMRSGEVPIEQAEVFFAEKVKTAYQSVGDILQGRQTAPGGGVENVRYNVEMLFDEQADTSRFQSVEENLSARGNYAFQKALVRSLSMGMANVNELGESVVDVSNRELKKFDKDGTGPALLHGHPRRTSEDNKALANEIAEPIASYQVAAAMKVMGTVEANAAFDVIQKEEGKPNTFFKKAVASIPDQGDRLKNVASYLEHSERLSQKALSTCRKNVKNAQIKAVQDMGVPWPTAVAAEQEAKEREFEKSIGASIVNNVVSALDVNIGL